MSALSGYDTSSILPKKKATQVQFKGFVIRAKLADIFRDRTECIIVPTDPLCRLEGPLGRALLQHGGNEFHEAATQWVKENLRLLSGKFAVIESKSMRSAYCICRLNYQLCRCTQTRQTMIGTTQAEIHP